MKHILKTFTRQALVLGCGNILFGDDGFGPAVIERLEKSFDLPGDVGLVDAGSGVREILFDLMLEPRRPKKIIIVDAVDVGSKPGEVFELSLDELPQNKIDDFSMHQLPTSNLLRELKDFCNVEVRIVSCQVEDMPEEVRPGLSKTLIRAVPKACEMVLKLCTNGE